MGDCNKIESPIGNLWVTPTGKNGSDGRHHIYVDLGSNINVEDEGPNSWQRKGPITIRGVQYHGSVHMRQWTDGLFHSGPEFANDRHGNPMPSRQTTEYERRPSLYMSKIGGLDNATEAARRACLIAVGVAVNDWVKTHQYILDQAETDRLEHEQERITSDIKELQETIAKKQTELNQLAWKLEAIKLETRASKRT